MGDQEPGQKFSALLPLLGPEELQDFATPVAGSNLAPKKQKVCSSFCERILGLPDSSKGFFRNEKKQANTAKPLKVTVAAWWECGSGKKKKILALFFLGFQQICL